MSERVKSMVSRRDMLRAVMTGAAAAAATTVPALEAAAAAPPAETRSEKRKARYRANSVEVQDFYRVNRYPAR